MSFENNLFALKFFNISIKMQYKRTSLKLSGEALISDSNYRIDPMRLAKYAQDFKAIISNYQSHKSL